MSKILISYRREDSADVTGRIYDRLVQQFGREAVFKDVDSIPLSVDFRAYLDEQVARCDVFLAVIGRNWMKANGRKGKSRLEEPEDFVRIEVESALKRNIPIIPVLVGGASIPPAERLPVSIQELPYRNGIAVRPDPDFHRDMDRLIAYLRTQLAREKEQLAPPNTQSPVSDVSGTERTDHSDVQRPRGEAATVKARPSEPDSETQAVKLEPEDRIAPSAASQTTTDGFSSYLLGGIGLIVLIGAVAAFLILQPKPSPDYLPPVVEKKKEQQARVVPPPAPSRHPEPVAVSTEQERSAEKPVMGNKPTKVMEKNKEPTARQSSIPAPQMVRISPGSFMMGSQQEGTLHEVRFTKPFAMARYETTFDEYDRFARATGRQLPDQRVADLAEKLAFKSPEWAVDSSEWESAPPKWKHDTYPVTNVTWDDATAYAEWLSQQTGKQYRLPTEAEWEYAARSGGTDEAWPSILNDGRFEDHPRFTKNRPVGMKQPNRLGLYDMNGNVWEWVKDCWHKEHDGATEAGSSSLATNSGHCDERVVRGGSWSREDSPLERMMSHRYGFKAVAWSDYVGFRLAQDLP